MLFVVGELICRQNFYGNPADKYMFKVKKTRSIYRIYSTTERVSQDKRTMSLSFTLNMFIKLIYLSVNLKHSITCRGRRMFRVVMQIIKILKTFIEGSVFVLLSIVCFVFVFVWREKLIFGWFSWSTVFHVYILHYFNVSTMRASTLLSIQWFFSYKRNLKKWKNGKQKKRDK